MLICSTLFYLSLHAATRGAVNLPDFRTFQPTHVVRPPARPLSSN